jgi:DNA-binding NarL/FixJ family response regulator
MKSTSRYPRVLLADDQRLVGEALAKLLEPRCKVVGTVTDGRALLAAAPQLHPDIVVLDIVMRLLNGLTATRQLKRVLPGVRVILLTASEDCSLAAEAFRAGASAFLLKNSAPSELYKAIQEVFEGRSYLTPLATTGLVESRSASPRQREVLQLLAEGHTMKEIARILNISARTVAFHKYTMMKELGIKSSAELVQFAIQQHVVSAKVNHQRRPGISDFARVGVVSHSVQPALKRGGL